MWRAEAWGPAPTLDSQEPSQGGWWLALRSRLSRARAIDDKYSRREEYRGFTQDFKEKDGYKPDVKIEYVDETGRKLTPKEVRGPPNGAMRAELHLGLGCLAPGWGDLGSVTSAGPGSLFLWGDRAVSLTGLAAGSDR